MTSEYDLDVPAAVRQKYGAIAKSIGAGCDCSATSGHPDDACGSGGHPSTGSSARAQGCCGGGADPISSELYSELETQSLPPEAIAASLGCGNPTALLPLEPGQTVLDLGCGGGIDVLLSAKRVGPAGKAYGLDMTEEMLALARENQRRAGATNVEFLKGTIESIPLPDDAVDVVISNCVINLSIDKDAVLREAFRVLKPGGRFAVSDVVVRGEIETDVRQSLESWVGCIAGALEEKEYVAKLAAAGFVDIHLDIWRTYREAGGQFASAFVRALKPARACCDAGCCG